MAVPAIVGGARVVRSTECHSLVAPSGQAVEVVGLDADLLARLLEPGASPLADVSAQDIVAFLYRVGRQWTSKDFARRRVFIRQLVSMLGYSPHAADAEADMIGLLLTSSSYLYQELAVELGHRFALDEWIPVEEALVRCFPLGRSVHVLAGNVPMSGVMSVVRGLLTKNQVIAKPASSDPVTPTQLALSFLDVDPLHPVALALSVVYWPAGSPHGEALLSQADNVTVWGSDEAVRAAWKAARPGVSFSAFGPMRSLAVIDARVAPGLSAERLAHDVVRYDQRACFSPLEAFVLGDVDDFVARLAAELADLGDLLPPAALSDDEAAAVVLSRLEEEFCGNAVLEDDMRHTVVIRADVIDVPWIHPLHRTIHITPISQPEEALIRVDRAVQTVAVHPWELGPRLAPELARLGACRVVEVGMVNILRSGATHDARYPLQELVRRVSVERGSDTFTRGMQAAIDQPEILRKYSYGDVSL